MGRGLVSRRAIRFRVYCPQLAAFLLHVLLSTTRGVNEKNSAPLTSS